MPCHIRWDGSISAPRFVAPVSSTSRFKVTGEKTTSGLEAGGEGRGVLVPDLAELVGDGRRAVPDDRAQRQRPLLLEAL
ncbi:hypothetical protein [Streptomyces sp. NBC_00286]|uniref:hypothetical protein n=1 Tax=Streptomyces sp. NBC_00286 TaxID=2975701 RepID=UPI002E2C8CEF|nr:hypothetical protein [Streptomyces sp. NBC_00286]